MWLAAAWCKSRPVLVRGVREITHKRPLLFYLSIHWLHAYNIQTHSWLKSTTHTYTHTYIHTYISIFFYNEYEKENESVLNVCMYVICMYVCMYAAIVLVLLYCIFVHICLVILYVCSTLSCPIVCYMYVYVYVYVCAQESVGYSQLINGYTSNMPCASCGQWISNTWLNWHMAPNTMLLPPDVWWITTNSNDRPVTGYMSQAAWLEWQRGGPPPRDVTTMISLFFWEQCPQGRLESERLRVAREWRWAQMASELRYSDTSLPPIAE